MSNEQFSLRWDNYYKNMSCGMNLLLANEDLVDVTIAIDGQYLKAHKMILSVCSPYFKTLFSVNPCKHPIVFMKDISYLVMKDLLTFMYQGEVQVNQENLDTFIKTAEALEIKGLAGDNKHEKETAEEVKIKKLVHQYKVKTITKQSTPILTKKMKFSPATEEMETTIGTPPIDSQIVIKPEFVSNINMINDCVNLKIEPCDSNPEDEVDDNQATIIREEGLNERKDYLMEGMDKVLAGTSADFMGDSNPESLCPSHLVELNQDVSNLNDRPKKKGTCWLCGRKKNSSASMKCDNCARFICKQHIKKKQTLCLQCVG